MTDQPVTNQPPRLSREEELDVLEAVYKIGKQKGLDLLRPEQLHKLAEAGRIQEDIAVDLVQPSPLPKQNPEEMANLIVNYLLNDLENNWDSEFNFIDIKQLSDSDKVGVLSDYFVYKYNMRPYELRDMLMGGTTNNG